MDPKLIYRRVCKNLDDRGWKYTPHDEDMVITLSVRGEDIPMELLFHVDAKRNLLKVLSVLPFKAAEDKRVEMAVAVCAANDVLANGNFDLNISDGKIVFRIAAPFEGGLPDETIDYLIDVTCATVDHYNDKLLMLNKGMLEMDKFLQNL